MELIDDLVVKNHPIYDLPPLTPLMDGSPLHHLLMVMIEHQIHNSFNLKIAVPQSIIIYELIGLIKLVI